jgi:GDP-L-fucose synthase
MLRKFHEAKIERARGLPASVSLWGTGNALREFLHVDDLAKATFDLVEQDSAGLFNVGSGEEVSIGTLATMIAATVGYEGPVAWDHSKPDGTPRKLLDSSRIRARGWRPRITLERGLTDLYTWYLNQAH